MLRPCLLGNGIVLDLFYFYLLHLPYLFTVLVVCSLYRTRKQVQESPYKDEIKLGTVVTQQRPPGTPAFSSVGTATNIVNNNNGGGSGGSATKKTSGRKT